MFRALHVLAHPQEMLDKRHFVHCVAAPGLDCSTDIHARNIPSAICAANPDDEQVMLETCRGP
jgi:hypothetical protein